MHNSPVVAADSESRTYAPAAPPAMTQSAITQSTPNRVESELREILAARERQLETQTRLNVAAQEQLKEQEKRFLQRIAIQRKKMSQLLQRKKKEMTEHVATYKAKIQSLQSALDKGNAEASAQTTDSATTTAANKAERQAKEEAERKARE